LRPNTEGVFIKATDADRKVACTEPTTVTTTTKTTTTKTMTTTTLTTTTNTIVGVLQGQLTETQQLLEDQPRTSMLLGCKQESKRST
jgi:hypothetical protein